MVDVLMLLWTALTSLFRSRVRLEAEILILWQQINVLWCNSPKRFFFRTFDRLVFVELYRLALSIVDALPLEFRKLIRDMSLANPLWGALRIHGEQLKLGVDVGQTSVAKYMARRRGGPPRGWSTFLCNHADGIASMDLFVVPTSGCYMASWSLRRRRCRIMWLGVTANRQLNGLLDN
jgi:hypothetical protein